MDPMQPPAPHAVADRASTKAQCEQLTPGDDSMLPLCEPGDQQVTWAI
jgi:hypothetical protein